MQAPFTRQTPVIIKNGLITKLLRLCPSLAQLQSHLVTGGDLLGMNKVNNITSTASLAAFEYETSSKHSASIKNDETFWGYILRDQTRQKSVSIIIRWMAKVAAVSMMLAAVGLWVLPGTNLSVAVLPYKLGLSLLSGFIGLMLFWISNHGTKYEVQVDLEKMELREAFRGENGKVRIFSKILFEQIEAVYLERSSTSYQKSRLMIRLAKSGQVIEVARDYEAFLPPLRDRLGRDILGQKNIVQCKSPRGTQMLAAQGVIKPAFAAE